ncbi:MAG: protein kinase domain-containing protein [Phototrophicaceae bacterium]|jgi:serine/threonine protein kinase
MSRFQEGDLIGQYRVIRRVGAGGMATVYLAKHDRLDRDVAVKVIHDTFERDSIFLSRFEREAQIVAGLDHPNIVPIYDYSDMDGQPYIVMKYVPGNSFRALLDESPVLPMEDILRLLTPIASALTYAHARGILHRDVKPSNIIIDDVGTPYLADFGLARITASGESTMSQDAILGTPQYISPEQAKGVKNLDGRADVYSLGIILYQVIVGDVPFSADTPYATIHDHIYTQLPPPSEINPDVPAVVEAVLEKALAKNPADRYSTATELMVALKLASEQAAFRVSSMQNARQADESLALYRDKRLAEASTPVLKNTTATLSPITPPISFSPEGISHPSLTDSKHHRRVMRYRHGWLWRTMGALAFLICLGIFTSTGAAIDAEQMRAIRRMELKGLEQRRQDVIESLPEQTVLQARRAINNNPNSPVAYLSAANTLWQRGMPDLAEDPLAIGLRRTDQPAEYLIIASELAEANHFTDVSVQLQLEALSNAVSAEQPYIREIVGESLYRLTHNPDLAPQLQAVLNDAVQQESPMAFLFLVNTQLTLGDFGAVEAAYNSRSTAIDDLYLAEAQLLEARYNLLTDDTDAAQDILEDLLEDAATPVWVWEAATDLLNLSTDASPTGE